MSDDLDNLVNAASDTHRANAIRAIIAMLPEHGEPRYDHLGNYHGMTTGDPDDHRTVGPHRAWSDCGEWCYPTTPCELCETRLIPEDIRAAIEFALEGQDT